MRISVLLTIWTILLPLVPADVIVLTTRQRVDGVITGYDSGQLAVRLVSTTGEIKIPISQVLQFTVVRSMQEPTQPVPLTVGGPRRAEMQQRAQERRATARSNQLLVRYNDLMGQGDALREQAMNVQLNTAQTTQSRANRQRAQWQAQILQNQAEQFYQQARDLQKQLDAAGVQVDRVPPAPPSQALPSLTQPGSGLEDLTPREERRERRSEER